MILGKTDVAEFFNLTNDNNNLWKISFGACVGYIGIGNVFFNGSFIPSVLAGVISTVVFSNFFNLHSKKEISSYQSQIDPTKTVDMNNWAVTLINTDDDTTSCLWGHAMIAIEGLTEQNLQVTYLTHLRRKKREPFGTVKLYEKFGNYKIDYVEKTETFLRITKKVADMVKSIKLQDGKKINFKSIIRKYVANKKPKFYNCLTWAFDHLKEIDIELKLKSLSFLPCVIPKQFTSK